MSVAEPVVLAESVKRKLRPGKLFLNGREQDAASGKTIDVMNPATGELLTTVPDGDVPDVDRGPVLAALRFHDADEAVEIANSTIYGLVSAVWTRDIQLAHRVASDIKAGVVWINTYNGFDTSTPFGGYKQSGFGRDLGAYALDQYTNVKCVWVAL